MQKKTVKRIVYEPYVACDDHGTMLQILEDPLLTRNKAIRKLHSILQELDEYQRANIYEATVYRWVFEVEPGEDIQEVFVMASYEQCVLNGNEPKVSFTAPIPMIPYPENMLV